MKCFFPYVAGAIRSYFAERIAIFAVISTLVIHGCSSSTRIEAPEWDAEALGAKAMQDLDANGDGVIDGAELKKAPGMKSALGAIDTDNNKLITKDEIASRIAAYKEVGLGMVPYVCAVHFRGKPLGGAKVRLIPEQFLTEAVSPATGTSKSSGYCVLRADDTTTPGIRVGIYRVEITSEQVKLAARYNEETVLGIEVSPGIASGSRPEIDVFEVAN
jgi:hypothetical protein